MTDALEVASGWIWSANVLPFLEMASSCIGYDFDESDWLAIADALPKTDDERPDGRYTYPLAGRSRLDVELSQAVGGNEVTIRLLGHVDDSVQHSLQLLLRVFARYKVTEG